MKITSKQKFVLIYLVMVAILAMCINKTHAQTNGSFNNIRMRTASAADTTTYAVEGQIYFNQATKQLRLYKNGAWQNVGTGSSSGGATTPAAQSFTGNGATTVYTLTDPSSVSISGVFMGGQRFTEGVHYTKNNTTKTVTFTTAPANGITFDVEYFSGVSISGGGGSGSVTNVTATNNTGQTWTITNPTSTPNLSLALTNAAVGLGNVDNTSDATKNSASATLTNKTISGASNTLSNIAESSVTNLVSDLAGKQPTLTVTAEKTVSYTASANEFVPADLTSGNFVLTLPNAPADGTRVGAKIVKPTSSLAFTYTINTAGSDVFNRSGGPTSATLSMIGQAQTYQYKASGGIWYVISDDEPLSQLDARYVSSTAGALTASNNLSDVSSAATALQNLGGLSSTGTFNTQTGNYTLTLSDFATTNGSETTLLMNSGSAQTLTVPPESSVNVPNGKRIYFRVMSTGMTTVVQGAGVTINASVYTTSATFQLGMLTKRTTNTWDLDLGPPPGLTNSLTGQAFAALGSAIKAQSIDCNLQQATTSLTLTTGFVRYMAVYLPTPATLTGVKFLMRTKGSYTANNNNRVGLYSYSAGTLTLVASSANDGTLWQTATSGTLFSVPFSSTYAAAAGVYFVGFIYSSSAQTTAPVIGAGVTLPVSAQTSADFTNSAFLTGSISGQTDIATSTQAASGVTAQTTIPWVSVY
jgi:hypothetical protein